MNKFNIIRQKIASLISPSNNSMSLPKQFLKNGNSKMYSDWSDVVMSDQDIYVGYPYAAIRNRANKVASIAIENIYTDSNNEQIHPYLQKIDTSPTFSNFQFWDEISTYLDLEGVYYLMVVRAIITNDSGVRLGAVQSFKLLNPYNIKRVIDKGTLEVTGYIESRNGLVREIPKEMIIEMRELNPFSDNQPYAMTDALKENQFTLKTTSNYTRHALKHNMNAPGILTTDVILEDNDFQNFVERVKNHTKGEPLFGNGSGAITWKDMNIDLDKAALKEVNEVNREPLFAVSGVSKTIMGIEQSGTTRETSKVQKDLYIENHILPRIQLIIDSLNQDYKNFYPNEYKANEYVIMTKNPTSTDYDKDIKEVELRDSQLALYNKLIAEGYDKETSADYVKGNLDVTNLVDADQKEVKVEPVKIESIKKKIANKLDPKEKQKGGLITQQQGALQNAIVNIETEYVAEFLNGVTKLTAKNSIDDNTKIGDIVPEKENKNIIEELALILSIFYGVVMSYKGSEVMRKRVSQYALGGQYIFNKTIKDYIKATSKKVAQNHIDTIADDLYKIAREAAKKGLSQAEIINEIKNKYSYDISETRAKAVARTETNRAFTRAQYEADTQFIEQNELQGKVYKKWHTRSDDPCEFCKALANEAMIPFDQSFRNVGETVTVGKGKKEKTLKIDFESLEAGNAHTNCSCEYELIIK